MSVRNEYESRLQARQQAFEQLRRQDDQAVNFRTAIACVGMLALWVVVGGWGAPWQLLLIPAGLFVAGLIYHEFVKRKQAAAKRAIEYYERCLARIDGTWTGVGPAGEEFADPLHPYSGDLDVFGTGSLFQLLNSPVTPRGAKTLAAWLAPDPSVGPPKRETVRDRQAAVQVLGDQLDLRERLAVIGPTKQSQQDAAQLQAWLSLPGGLTARWILFTAIPLGLLGLASLWYLAVTQKLSMLIIVVLVQVAFLQLLRAHLNTIKKHSEHAVFELRRILQVLHALETIDADTTELNRLRGELIHDSLPASQTIRKLERIVSQFENMRHNLFFAPFAFLFMFSLLFACRIDHWRMQHGKHVEGWFRAIGELEALLAFSQLHYEHPEYCFPELTDQRQRFTAKQLAHPLLTSHEAIANDIELSENCRMLLVSGSNMSGKSTMLRSVGVNAILAWAGAPVCAKELQLSRLQVAAAMRMQDSLQSGTSHFFAELKRIQLVVELAQSEAAPTVLFLLDEILHGTNSHDRLVGAKGVIESLLKTGAIGLVTTHDLALSEIVEALDTPSQNVHFRDEWVDGEMTFDYRMREGVVPKSNALSLMRLLGLDV